MNTFAEALQEALNSEETSEELKADIRKLGEEVDAIVADILSKGFPIEGITLRTIDEEDGGMLILFLFDGKEIPPDTTYEEFMESNSEDTHQ